MPHVVEGHNGLTWRGRHIPHLAVVTVSCCETCTRISEHSAVVRRRSFHVQRLPGSALHALECCPCDKECSSDSSPSFWVPDHDGRRSAQQIHRYRAIRSRRLFRRISGSMPGKGRRHRETEPNFLGTGFCPRNRPPNRRTSLVKTPNPFTCTFFDASTVSPQKKTAGTQNARPCPGMSPQDRTSVQAWSWECRRGRHSARSPARWIRIDSFNSTIYPSGSSQKAITRVPFFIGPGGLVILTPAAARSAQAL